jgi:hypothetical protein
MPENKYLAVLVKDELSAVHEYNPTDSLYHITAKLIQFLIMAAFWDFTLYNVVCLFPRFGRIYYL